MQYRTLGRTGWKVSTISFGAWAIGGTWGPVEDDEVAGGPAPRRRTGRQLLRHRRRVRRRAQRALDGAASAAQRGSHIATKAGRRLDPHVAEGYNRET